MESILLAGLVILAIAVLFNYVLTFALIRRLNAGLQSPSRKNEFLKIGQPAPDFTAESLNGGRVTLADYAGQAVTFLFFSAGCEPCRQALPTYEALWSKAQQAGFELVLVSFDNATRTRAFVNEHQVTLPILIAPRGENPLETDYKIPGTPFYCMVDEQGLVQSTDFADVQGETWQTFVASWQTLTARVPSLVLGERG